jgi:hypothetical protein
VRLPSISAREGNSFSVLVVVLESVGRAVEVMEFWSVGRPGSRKDQSRGANSTNNFSKRGSFRSGSQYGSSLSWP